MYDAALRVVKVDSGCDQITSRIAFGSVPDGVVLETLSRVASRQTLQFIFHPAFGARARFIGSHMRRLLLRVIVSAASLLLG